MSILERLVALEDIKFLKARYCRFVDLKLWDDFEQLFLLDATFEAPPGRPRFDDRSACVPATCRGFPQWVRGHPSLPYPGDTVFGT